MTIGNGHDRGGRTAATLRGILFIVAAGLALGALYNSIGRASRPPRGLPWVKRADAVASLEAMQRDTLTGGPMTGAARATPSSPATATVPAPATGTAAGTPATGRGPAVGPRPPLATAPKPAPPVAQSVPVAAPRSAAAAPAAATPVPPVTAPAAAPTDLPVIPDLDHPIQLEMASLKKLYDAGAVLVVDAREAGEYADGHIAGATSLPYNDALAEPERIRHLGENGRPIAVYCSGGACELSMDLAKLLLENGRKRVLVYQGGYPEWQAAGLPVARGAQAGGH